MKKGILLLSLKKLFFLFLFISFAKIGIATPHFLIQLNRILGERLMADQFSPPVASRIYMYPNLGAYEAMQQVPLWDFLKGIPPIRWPVKDEVNSDYTAAFCFIQLASKLIYSSDQFEKQCKPILDSLAEPLNPKTVEQSIKWANEIKDQFLSRASSDGYKQRLTFVRYSISDRESDYKLTPPNFSDPVEPYWGTIQPLILNSQLADTSLMPNKFNLAENTPFQREVKEVYQLSKINSDSTLTIARHWDCNPIQMEISGHVMQFAYRMTPAQHWISLLCDIAENNKIPVKDLSALLAKVSVACFEAFIDCWNIKYLRNSIRPVSVINAYIDSDWRPAIETPAFPEYPSGHSLVSAASSIVLSDYFGSEFNYVDSTQLVFNLPSVKFANFRSAALQAGESRILGGIHFRKAVLDGFQRGETIGKMVIEKWLKKP